MVGRRGLEAIEQPQINLSAKTTRSGNCKQVYWASTSGAHQEWLRMDLPVQTLEGNVVGYVKSPAMADGLCILGTRELKTSK